MSLLAEILATADQVEMDDLNLKVNEVSDKILSLKREVMEAMDNIYVKFLPYSDDNKRLLINATSLHSELTSLHSRIENQIKRELSDSTGELESLRNKLQQTDFYMNITKRLCEIRQCFDDAVSAQKACSFFQAAEKLKEAEALIINVEEEIKLLDIYDALEEELSRLRSNFLYTVLEKWRPCIKWNEIVKDSNKKNNEITLSIMDTGLKSDLVKALHNYDVLIIEINKFGDKFLHKILIPLFDKKSKVIVTNEENYSSLVIQTKDAVDTHGDVIKNLVVIFNFLFSHFDINIDGDDVSDDSNSNNFIKELGERISNEFLQNFIQNCLDKAVPKCQEELDSYTQIVQDLLQLEQLLHDRGFLSGTDNQLVEYSENVDVLITNKICDSYLESARKLMKKDLHDMISAGSSDGCPEMNDTFCMQDFKARRKLKSFRPPDSDHHVYVSELCPNMNQFPACQISKSAAELIELVNALLEESTKSKTKNCAVKLFCMARYIFRLYCDIVPLHHKKMLDTLPQQAALLNNNCYYLSHNLLMLGSKYKAKQSSTLQDDMIVTFVDLIDSLQNVGKKVLSNQIDFQKKQILDILRDSGLVTVTESTEFPKGIEKAIRQCIRQLLLLQKVWYQVLPTNSYCELMGVLAFTFVRELVDRVCSFIDIPAHTASELVIVFTIVQDKIPNIFPEPNEIYQHVRNWTKFNELVKLLSASLQDVEERWSDGKGPLAQEFTADQVKQLVKALFQISDKRAELLSRIV